MSFNLRKAVRAVHLVDTFRDREEMFASYVSRHFIARVVISFHRLVKNSPISALMFTVFGVRYLLFRAFAVSAKYKLCAPVDYINEKRAITDFLDRVGDELIAEPESEKRSEAVRQLRSLLRNPRVFFKVYRFFRRYEKHGTFLTCCRISETIWAYVGVKEYLKATSSQGVVVATNYAPTACALIAAARELELKVIYTSHAIIPYDAAMPKVEADLAYLYSKRAIEAFDLHCGIDCKVIHYTGVSGPNSPMRLADSLSELKSVGVFLTGYTVQAEFERLIRELSDMPHIQRIIIRLHPLPIANPDVRFASAFPKVVFDSAGRAYDTAMKCDFVIAGSSSVHIEVVKCGKPSLYWEAFDTIGPDYYRFIRDGVLFLLDDVKTLDWNSVKAFYGPDWIRRFRELDCSYMHPPAEINDEMRDVLERVLSVGASPEPAPRSRPVLAH